MEWIPILPSDLECALNKPQLELLKAESLKSLNRDICQDIISTITSRIRAEIASSGLNNLDADHSRIPKELKECALRLAVEALQLRLPKMELSNLQVRHADLAREMLSRVANGDLPVTKPFLGIKTASPKKGFYSKSAQRLVTRKSMRGY